MNNTRKPAYEYDGTVYLLHYAEPYPGGRKPQHYLGWTGNLAQRVTEHAMGRGAVLTRVMAEQDITFVVAATWRGSKRLERQLKDRHNHRRLCAVCRMERDCRE